jgi:hypothetical protein
MGPKYIGFAPYERAVAYDKRYRDQDHKRTPKDLPTLSFVTTSPTIISNISNVRDYSLEELYQDDTGTND